VLSNVGSGSLSSFVVGNQIQSGVTSVITNGTTQIISFTQGSTELARITGTGRLGIGTATPSAALDVNGNAFFTGNVTAANFITASDRRFKQNIETIEHADKIVSSLQGVRFLWRNSLQADVGCIAQDVAQLLPEAVSGDVESGLHVAYDKLVPVLIEAIKHLTNRVEQLEKRVPL
jgi:hypothetical protein